MHKVILESLTGIMCALAQSVATPENVQYLIKCVARRARAIAEDTETKIDDVVFSFLEGIAVSYDKSEAIAEWIKDALIPNRCQSEEEALEAQAELTAILTENKAEFIDASAYFIGLILPILVAYYGKEGNFDDDEN